MPKTDSTEKTPRRIQLCPLLPEPPGTMSYRDIRSGISQERFAASLTYANYLWSIALPARAILALCRAIYLDPQKLDRSTRQPYQAYVWILLNYRGQGFLGNPRVSFIHQATRIPESQILKRQRAWALWHLTRECMPDLPPDPDVDECPPSRDDLAGFLNENGMSGEGVDWLAAMEAPRKDSNQEAGAGLS